jgi:hypothetical protein
VQDIQQAIRDEIDAQPCADLDADGLLDIYETNDRIFVNAYETGTNPAAADTDGDGYLDGIEVAQGSDPNDARSLPASPGP